MKLVKPPDPTFVAQYRNQTELGKAIGVSKATMSKYLKRPDWPDDIKKRAPWNDQDRDRLVAWRQSLQDDRSEKAAGGRPPRFPDLAESRERARAAVEIHRARKLKAEADKLEHAQLPREMLINGWAAMARIMRNGLEGMAHPLAQDLPGPTRQNLAVIKRYIRDVCQRIADQERIEIDQAPDPPAEASS